MKNPLRTEDVVFYELKEMEKVLDYWDYAADLGEEGAWYRASTIRKTVNKLRSELTEIALGI